MEQSLTTTVKGFIKISLVEYHNFKNLIEIFKEFHDNVTFRFHPKGFTFIESNEQSAAAIHCDINHRWLMEYGYDMRDQQGELLPEYLFTVNTTEFSRNAKQEGKKSILTFYVTAPENGSPASIAVERDLTYADQVVGGVSLIHHSRSISQIKNVRDYYVEYYRSRGPRLKILMSNFHRIINSAKTSKCTEVNFCLTHNGTVLLKCVAHERVIHQFDLRSQAEDNFNFEESSTMSFQGSGGMLATFQIEDYKISLKTNQCHQWLTKLSKLGGKIIEVYLDHRLPLVLVSLFGDGIGEFRATFGLQPSSYQ